MYWLNQQGQPTIIDQTLPNWKEIYRTLTWLSFITGEPVETEQPIVEDYADPIIEEVEPIIEEVEPIVEEVEPIVEPVEEVIEPVEEITDENKPVSKKKK